MSQYKYPLELLSPAKNLECGIAAINHGADAVYIGAPDYGARKSAANSIDDIARLVRHAHLYRSKIYVALNTILFDHELEGAALMAHQLYNIGVDALIIQDYGLLNAGLPPIEIHSSTQMDNRTPEKVKFLQDAGFRQVVLARELSLDQIKAISKETDVRLEYFVHGALCVSYSGQCYMSQSINGRSANRGECGQPCRLKYKMTAADGTVIAKDQHLLSMKDLNLSDYLEPLIDAGISSFKIEGRLKEKDYVANITAHYRRKLDEIIDRRPELARASSGVPAINFEPDPSKSFNRGFTTYFVDGRQKDIWSVESPKSTGEKIGKVMVIDKNRFKLDNGHDITNGDGLCFFDRTRQLQGIKVNQCADGYIYPQAMNGLYAGATIFRNYNHQFSNIFKRESAQRHIAAEMYLEEGKEGIFTLSITDEDDITSYSEARLNVQPAKNPIIAADNIKSQLSKTGGTAFKINNITINTTESWFISASELNALRRDALTRHEELRITTFSPSDVEMPVTTNQFPQKDILKNGNIVNRLAAQFMADHGAEVKELGYERQKDYDNNIVMTTKHCILHEQDKCLKLNPGYRKNLPIFISNERDNYELKFNCKDCEMQIIRRNTKQEE